MYSDKTDRGHMKGLQLFRQLRYHVHISDLGVGNSSIFDASMLKKWHINLWLKILPIQEIAE